MKKKSRCLENETSEEGDMCVTVNERCRGNRRRILFQRASERSSRAPERRERKKLRREIGKGLSPAPAPHPPPTPPEGAAKPHVCLLQNLEKRSRGLEAVEMPLRLKSHTALAEDPRSGLSSHVGQLTAT